MREVSRDERHFLSRGAHLIGPQAWLVNTTGSPLVTIRLGPMPRGRLLGFPIRVRELTVSPDDADALIAELGSGL